MDISLRQHITQNIKDLKFDEMKSSISDAITSGDEKALIGLGVVFEIIWNKSNEDMRANYVNQIVESFK